MELSFSYTSCLFVVLQVTVIEEAIKYIDELHDALADRLNLQQSKCHFRVSVCT